MRYTVLPIARYTFLEAWRGRLLWVAAATCVLIAFLATFLSGVAITEQAATRVSFSAGVIRVSVVFMVTFFVVTAISREISDKGLELFVAMPLSRTSYTAGRLAGFALVSGVVVVIAALVLIVSTPGWERVVVWSLSLYFETLLVAAFGYVCALGLRQGAAAIFATIAFYMLARSIDALQLIARNPLQASADGGALDFARHVVDAVAYLIPSLGRFTETAWLIYPDSEPALGLIVGQSAIYVALLCGALLLDFHRREL